MACHGQAPWGATEPLDIRKGGREPQIAVKNGVRIETSEGQVYALLGSANKLMIRYHKPGNYNFCTKHLTNINLILVRMQSVWFARLQDQPELQVNKSCAFSGFNTL